MEIITDERVIELLMSLVGAALLGLIGFVWKISHKVSGLERQLEHQREARNRDYDELRKDIDMIMENVSKNREWTTSRMMSIAKDLPR